MRMSVALIAAAVLVSAVSLARAADPVVVAPPPAPAIPGNRAGDYVGQDVTVEGRVTAIHESPLATVIAFSQNFAGFTATILAADRDKFPRDLDARIRDHVVHVTGTVTTYRGKPEMALHDPAQLVLAPPPGPGSVAAAPPASPPSASPDRSSEELRRALGRIETRLEAIEGRLTTIEQGSPDSGEPAAAPQR
jgi:hypothetical protein